MFTLRAISPMTIGTRRVLRGAQIEADASTAQALLQDRLAVLVDENDLPRLLRALGADVGRRPAPITR
jgi:hypothetical protein